MSSNNSVLLNYMSSLSANYEHSLYLLPWKNAVLVQNYFEADGNLVNLKDSKTKNPWVLLEACQFTYKDSTFVKFVCQHCNKVLKDMNHEQHPEKLVFLLCYHSEALHHILNAEDQGYEFPPENNPNDLKQLSMKNDLKKATFNQTLIAVLQENKISTLFTLGRQSRPRCSKCVSDACKCIQYYNKYCKDISIQSDTSSDSTDSKSSTSKSTDDNNHHWSDRDSNMGYNFAQIKYPLYSDPSQSEMIDLRKSPSFSFPSELYPPFDPSIKCKHGHQFIEDNAYLQLSSENVILYEESKQTVLSTKIYDRVTGNCRCRAKWTPFPSLPCFSWNPYLLPSTSKLCA